ncbi:hypothetical protein ILYODFUR_035742 [Ilyodon furcidens]|uniref:Uncharacterized protein n=1 Tax=Ilyodon furcidens TaxID=33524 RepID=A0ABV0TS81_9TELE
MLKNSFFLSKLKGRSQTSKFDVSPKKNLIVIAPPRIPAETRNLLVLIHICPQRIFNDHTLTSTKPCPLRTGSVMFDFERSIFDPRHLINIKVSPVTDNKMV